MILYLVEVLIDGRREFQTCGLYTVKEEACAEGMEQLNFGLPMITAWVEGEYTTPMLNLVVATCLITMFLALVSLSILYPLVNRRKKRWLMVRVFGLMIDRYQPHSVSVYHDGKLMREWYMDTAHDAQQFATTLYAAHQLLSQEPT